MPGVLLASAIAIIGDPNATILGRAIVGAPILLLAFWLVTLAEVRVGPAMVQARRGLRWRSLSYSEIISVGRFWSMGYLRLRQRVAPWGLLFFVPSSIFITRDRLVTCIREGVARGAGPEIHEPLREALAWRSLIGSACLGVLIVFMAAFLTPAPELQRIASGNPGGLAGAAGVLAKASSLLFRPPWSLLTALAFFLAAASGYRPKLSSFLGGLVLAWFVVAAAI